MKSKKNIFRVIFLLLLIGATIKIACSQHNTPYQHNEGMIFGTVYHITYQYGEDLNKDILAELQKVDDALSMFNKQSEITKVNNNQDIVVGRMFKEVFTLAEMVSEDTNGAFDITVAPLVNAWGFGFKNGSMPTKHTIDSLRTFVGFDKVSMKDGRIKKADPRTMLDCGAIAKGYGSDVVADFLRRKGTDTCWAEENTLNPILFLSELQDFINKRHEEMPEGSYTTSLFKKGVNKMAQKVGEEAIETVIEATNGTDDKLIYESSDLLYHLIVLLTSKGLRIEDVVKELQMRHDPEWDKKRRVAKSKGEMK